jgi:hypothetical protein
MDILIACHKNPEVGVHANLFFVNRNRFIEPKTRKRSVSRIRNNAQGNRVFYLDTDTVSVSAPSPNFFSTWDAVGESSMDVIWAQYCPNQAPFSSENIYWSIQGIEGPIRNYTDDHGPTYRMWNDLLLHGRRILKVGGKLVVPIPRTKRDFAELSPFAKELLVMSTFRVINMEICPDYLFRASVFAPHSPQHAKELNNLFIGDYNELMKDQFKKWMLLVIEKPDPEDQSWAKWGL